MAHNKIKKKQDSSAIVKPCFKPDLMLIYSVLDN